MLRVQNLVSQYDLDENLLFAGASETSWLLANKGHDLLSAFDDSSLLLSSAVASVSTSSASSSSSSPATSIRATQPDLFFSEFLSGALDVPVDVVNFEDTVDCTSFSVNNKRRRDEDDLLDHLDDQLFVDDIYQHRVKRPCYTSLFDEEDDEDLRSELVLEEEEDVAIAFSYRDQVLGSLTFSTDAATAYLVAPACVSPTELFFDVELTTSASFSNTAAAPLVSASTSVSAAPVPATAATTVVVDHAAATAVAPSTPGRSISAPSGSLSSSKSKKPRRTKRVHSRREVLEAVSGFDRDEMKGVLRVLYPNQLIIESDGCDLESAISQLDATRYDQLRSYVNNILTQPSKNTSATSSTPALPNTGLTISHATPLSPLSPSSSSLLQPLQPVLPATYQPLPQLSPVFSSPPSSPASSASPPPRSRAPAAKKKSSPKRKTTSSSSRKPKASSTAAATAVAAATAATGSSSSSPLAPAGSVFEKEEVVTMQRAEEDEDEFVDIDS